MKYQAACCCAALLLAGSGCGLVLPQPDPLELDNSVLRAAQVLQSLKEDFRQNAESGTSAPRSDAPASPASVQEQKADVPAQSSWVKRNWSHLAWAALLLIFGIMWLMDKCSDKWGIPSQETMDRLSCYLVQCLPLTQKTVYAALRKKYLKLKENKGKTS